MDALAVHHKLVMDLCCMHNWDITIDYDIQQCDMMMCVP